MVHTGDKVGLLMKQANMEPIEYLFSLVSNKGNDSEHAFIEEAYDLGRELGRGNFATVKLAVSKTNGNKYAVKIVDKAKFLQHQHREGALLDEVNILKFLQHDNIIKLEETYETEKYLYLVLELVTGGELFDLVVDAGRLTEDVTRTLFIQMLDAVGYMHSQGIAHRDLKPENMLLAAQGSTVLKISDFGLSRILGVDSVMGTLCGTPQYIAPEILSKSGNGDGYSVAVDMWSLGVILYVCLSGMLPYLDDADMSVFEQIQRGLYSFPTNVWGQISEEAKDLIRRLMQIDPTVRWTAKQAKNHPWCTQSTMEATPIPIRDSFASIRTKPVDRYRGKATMEVMIKASIAGLAESKGSSPEDMANFICANYDSSVTAPELTSHLQSLAKAGDITATKQGLFKLCKKKGGKKGRRR